MNDPRALIGGGFPLGQRWAVEIIADILPPSCARKVRPHHIAPLESVLYRALWLFGEPPDRFTRRVRASYRVLEDGFDRTPAVVGQIFGETVERLGHLQQAEHNLHEDAWGVDKADPDRRFRSLLALYQMTYEKYYRTLAAPFVVAGQLATGDPDPTARVGRDGRVKLNVIGELEAGRGIADRAFTAGLDNHLRNSAAHSHFEVVAEDEIRMWDLKPRSGDYSWGPHTFTFWDLRERVYALSVTSSILLTAVILFDISRGRMMYERGWLKPSLRPRRSDVLRSELGETARLHGLSVTKVEQEGTRLYLELRVLGEEVPNQDSVILSDGSTGVRRYVQTIRTYHAPAWRQAYGFLQLSYDLHGYYEVVEIALKDRTGSVDLGRLLAPRDVREAMVTAAPKPEELRARMELDTLPDSEIPVVMKGPPREAPG